MRKAWDPLVKQTYSVWVDGPRGRRKWHLSRSSSRNLVGNEGTHVAYLLSFPAAYFTQATVDRLQTVDDKPELASLEVPPGKYISTRLGKPRRADDSNRNLNSPPSLHDVFRPANAAAPRTYAPFPMPFQVTPPQPGGIASSSQPYSHSNQHSSPAINGYDYAQQQQQVSLVLPTRGETSRQNYGGMPPRYPEGPTLPPINSLASPSSAPPVDQQIPDYFSTMQQRAFSQRAHDQGNYGVPTPAPPHYLHYPHTQEAQRQFMQLPTPTSSSSHSSPVYSPHEQSDGSGYGGHLMLSYPSPASSVGGHLQAGASYPSQEASTYGYSYPYSQERRSGPSAMGSYESANASSPEDQKSSSESPANRPILTLPPHIANRYTPPLSEPREDNDGSYSSGLSPPQSPLSAISSSSNPGGKQLNLAPLRTLVRAQTHPYRRDKFDDKALMALSGRRANE